MLSRRKKILSNTAEKSVLKSGPYTAVPIAKILSLKKHES